ncbi:hypothetical protein AURDEDRAFT_42028, partial [Auricularia subglabra TFB-10046 SS5]
FFGYIVVLDCFHENGHAGCALGCFFSQYNVWSDELRRVDWSAAKPGNSGILKARHTVSYMTERHAVITCNILL